ncbi:MAG TPA: methyltransferase domain-containing protein [Rhodospirillales bacterium]|nr:methyltransferase domain-containing protein [Rhodospirillales bacterium]
MSDNARYDGPDLNVFAEAHNWYAYLARLYAPHLGHRVLEVGAGIGTITEKMAPYVANGVVGQWVCLEPDNDQSANLKAMIASGKLPAVCTVSNGLLADLPAHELFDLILYSDVLEHIEDDQGELLRAAEHLTPGGRLLVMSPAHNWLFSDLDRLARHFRRYTRSTLCAIAPPGLKLVDLKYLDSASMAASLANKLALRRGTPSPAQILLWDRGLVRISRWLDPLTCFRIGKSILAVWHNTKDEGKL